ncbi:MAG: deoxynucleoside kinase [Anaerolineales bacterium]|nr:deoxynucleoside kinase [Anaerolineales bacterium]
MYVAIEGVIGVGKTTLARLLQPTFKAKLILEAFEENPFLSDFYGDRARYAFQTQIFFLLSRYRQQREISSATRENENLIADYTFGKDALFARLNLSGDELATYTQVHKALAERITPPELIVFLRANTDVALQRIAMRDRSYERNMDYAYIDELNQAYEDFFSEKREQKVLIIDTNPLDFVAHTTHLENVGNRIRAALGIPPYQPELPFDEAIDKG